MTGSLLQISPGETQTSVIVKALRQVIQNINSNVGPSVSGMQPSRASAAAATIPGGTAFILTQGYATAGDGGGALYIPASGSTTGGFQSADGQWWQIAEVELRPEMFGAAGDGSTNDTTAIANAISVVPTGGRLLLSAKEYLVVGSGSAIFTLTSPINIEGQGTDQGSTFLLGSGIGTNRDLFHVVPPSGTTQRGFNFRNFSVIPHSGSVGRHIIHLDTSGSTTANLAEILIDGIYFASAASAGGYSIYLNNGNGDNNGAGGGGGTGSVEGGTFNLTVQNCLILGGINVIYGGDTLRFYNNLMSTSLAIINQIAGAGNLQWMGNNCSFTGGLSITQAIKPIIAGNEFEQQLASTQFGDTIPTNNSTAAGNATLHFASVPPAIVPGMMVSDITTPGALSPGSLVLSTTSTTVVMTALAIGSGVLNGDIIGFGGIVVDISGNAGTVDSAIIRDNQIQCIGSIGNSPLLRIDNASNSVVGGNRFGVPTPYVPVLITSNATNTTISGGNSWPGLSASSYVLDLSSTTSYPYKTSIMGTTGSTQVAAGATDYITPGQLSSTESTVSVPFPSYGVINNLNVYSQGAPGAGQTYTFTLRDASSDTSVTCQISGASSNFAQDTTHKAAVAAADRWSLKAVSSISAAAAAVSFTFDYHTYL